jgi:plasmid stabilization system protein ParE
MSYAIRFDPGAALQVQRERAWLYANRGRERADAFEAELDHWLDLLAEHPRMGNPIPHGRRHFFLMQSRFHMYYRVLDETQEILVLRLRHEKQRPLKL